MKFYIIIAAVLAATGLPAEDWRAFRHDFMRSGKTPEQLEAPRLTQEWVYDSGFYPEPAWYGPAKRDSYARIEGLRSMRDYDTVLHTIQVGNKVFLGSTVDHTVTCLAVDSGKVLWRFVTGGPVRVVPTFEKGKIYVGSDDGFVYCLSADSGKLLWKFSPVENSRQLVAYNNLISMLPCRTGVTVADGQVYCGFSMLPWETTYLCALDAETGKQKYAEKYEELTMEAPFAFSAGRLIAPQGRIAPVIFDAETGKKLGALKKGGGSFVLITDDHRIIHGPGNKKGWMNDSDEKDPAKIVSINNANAMLVHGGKAVVLSDGKLECFNRKDKKKLWSTSADFPFSLILAGTHLYAGGLDKVAAFDSSTGKKVWQGAVEGRAKGLTAANGRLLVSTDTGKVFSFTASGGTVWVESEAKKGTAKRNEGQSTLAVGPFVSFVDAQTARVEWQTAEATACEFYFYTGDELKVVKSSAGKAHKVDVKGLKYNFIHHYQIARMTGGKKVFTKQFELDTFFNFSVNKPKLPKDGLSRRIQKLGLRDHGIAVVVGAGRGRLAESLLGAGFKKVIYLESESRKVELLRNRWLTKGLYGAVVIYNVESWSKNSVPAEFANLVVSEVELEQGRFPGRFEDLYRLLKTGEGAIMALNSKTDMKAFVPPVFAKCLRGAVLTAAPLADSASWQHQYGNPDNAGFAGEGLSGVSSAGEMELRWLGRPGPRFQADRNGRKTSPLVAGGKLFVQGLERIVALDRANGAVIWSREMPGFMRFNIPRDCSNWCTDGEFIYAADKNHCLKISCATGDVVSVIPLAKPHEGGEWEWSYIANYKSLLLGSCAKKGTHHTNFFGAAGQGWYDAGSGPVTYKLCSDNIFAKSKSGKMVWKYEKGLIINSTITLSNNRVFFIESHSRALKQGKARRLDDSGEFRNNLYLVSLDMKTGRAVWKHKISPDQFKVMLHLASSEGVLVMMSSASGKYFVQGFSGKSGKLIWKNSGPWKQSHHGGHMSRPVIVGHKVYVRPNVFDLKTGHLLDELKQPFGSCGTYAATAHSMIYRQATVTMWGMEKNQVTKWARLRPGCWLSTLPAEGMILSPEAGGGCSCGKWLETSVGFAPKKRAELMFSSAEKHFVDSFKVTLINLAGKGTIRYTMDGSEPVQTSTTFSKPFTIKKDCMVKAALFFRGSKLASVEREFIRVYPAPEFIANQTAFVEGTPLILEIKTPVVNDKPVIRYTLDSDVPGPASPVYKGKIVLNKSTDVSLCAFYADGGKSKVITKAFKQLKMCRPANVSPTKNGVTYTVVNKRVSKMPNFAAEQNLKRGKAKGFDLSVAKKATDFAVLFECYIKVDEDGSYQFQTSSDDGSMLWIGDYLVVNNDGVHGDQKRSGTVALKQGVHKLKVGFFDAGGAKVLNVWMGQSGKPLVKLKPSQLWIR